MWYSHTGGLPELIEKFRIGATVIAGQAVIIGGAVGTAVATITDATTTSLADAVGVTYSAGTYSTVQGAGDVRVPVSYNPLSFFTAAASGGAGNVPLATTAPSNILTNTSASSAGTTITAAEVGTVDMDGGYLVGLTGANKGQYRVSVTHTNNTSAVVTQPFNSTIAVGDKFVRLPWSPFIVQTIQLTTLLDQADAIIVTGTGGTAVVVKVTVNGSDESNPTAKVTFTFGNHILNPLS